MSDELLLPKELAAVAAAVKLPNSTAVERIYAASLEEAHGTGPGIKGLSKADQLVNQQMEAAYALLLNYHTFEQAWPLMAKQFDISRATCFRRLADAQNLYGDLKKVKKQGARALLLTQVQMIKQLCLTQRPPDVRGALAAAKLEAVLQGLLRADAQGEDSNSGSGNTSYIINLQVGDKKPKAIDLGKLDDVTDAEYELIQEAVQQNVFGAEQMEQMLLELREGEDADDGNR
ncbi:hypothetical protein [Hymenobacter crusticola]|uniref:Uncharacterized protein n=1 Tax=Hymenobacter crusticola TaxID=1770526 RepID=A0A243W5U7_9BACT|nr:hypothetical protein [Hymenobacter crusticola]OUJ68662.1 hypothetical protein BXP70_27630 [Hymenobacter crusticola]